MAEFGPVRCACVYRRQETSTSREAPIHPPSEFKRRPRVLDAAEAEQFFDAFNDRYWTPHRDRLACQVMYEAGLRVSEVLALKDDHIEETPLGGRLVVREGKGGKDRTVGLGRQLTRSLSEWLERRDAKVPEAVWVFPTSNGKRVARQHLHRTVKRVARRAGLPEADRLTVHCLRHSFATRFLKNGGNLEELRRALGHSSLSVTQKYLQLVDDAHVRSMMEQANGEDAPQQGEAPQVQCDALEQRLAELERRLLDE